MMNIMPILSCKFQKSVTETVTLFQSTKFDHKASLSTVPDGDRFFGAGKRSHHAHSIVDRHTEQPDNQHKNCIVSGSGAKNHGRSHGQGGNAASHISGQIGRVFREKLALFPLSLLPGEANRQIDHRRQQEPAQNEAHSDGGRMGGIKAAVQPETEDAAGGKERIAEKVPLVKIIDEGKDRRRGGDSAQNVYAAVGKPIGKDHGEGERQQSCGANSGYLQGLALPPGVDQPHQRGKSEDGPNPLEDLEHIGQANGEINLAFGTEIDIEAFQQENNGFIADRETEPNQQFV